MGAELRAKGLGVGRGGARLLRARCGAGRGCPRAVLFLRHGEGREIGRRRRKMQEKEGGGGSPQRRGGGGPECRSTAWKRFTRRPWRAGVAARCGGGPACWSTGVAALRLRRRAGPLRARARRRAASWRRRGGGSLWRRGGKVAPPRSPPLLLPVCSPSPAGLICVGGERDCNFASPLSSKAICLPSMPSLLE